MLWLHIVWNYKNKAEIQKCKEDNAVIFLMTLLVCFSSCEPFYLGPSMPGEPPLSIPTHVASSDAGDLTEACLWPPIDL